MAILSQARNVCTPLDEVRQADPANVIALEVRHPVRADARRVFPESSPLRHHLIDCASLIWREIFRIHDDHANEASGRSGIDTMGISELPTSTVRVIGASQALTDPASVVKELIDNALDAHATSVSIEISANTLDVIQVRDNGCGIPPEDRVLVARPHCTSKITGEDDLKEIGGTSLGFRGEALASVAELSGSLAISTRVEGEPVATSLKISSHGEVTGQEPASMAVGTMVKIADFIKANPVRRQQSLKNAEKSLRKIKQMLQAYAFARPQARFSLRVTKAKNDKGNWTYAPKPGGNLEDAAFKIVGAACASQCDWTVVEENGFTLQAFLPRIDADANKLIGVGAYLSIDARPISVARGTPKQVIKIYREALKRANPCLSGITEPILCLQIKCPTGSYDPNVEPAKDDVLFEDPEIVLTAVRHLFDTVYPAPNSPAMHQDSNLHLARKPLSIAEEAEGLLSRETVCQTDEAQISIAANGRAQQASHDDDTEFSHAPQRDDARATTRPNMYGCDEEDLELVGAQHRDGEPEDELNELNQARQDISVSNPWIMAKMNTSLHTPMNHDRMVPLIDLERPVFPTPRTSSPAAQQALFTPQHESDVGMARIDGSQTLLPRPSVQLTPSSSVYNPSGTNNREDRQARSRPVYDYGINTSDDRIALENEPAFAASVGPRRGPRKQGHHLVNKPFIQPFKATPERGQVWFDHLEKTNRASPGRGRPKHNRNVDNSALVNHDELEDTTTDLHRLSPPRHNRDVREFFTPTHSFGHDVPAVELTERRIHGVPGRRPVPIEDFIPNERMDENTDPALEIERGFVPASKIATLEEPMSLPEKQRPTKHRKKSGSRVLRERSTHSEIVVNVDEEEEEEEEAQVGDQRDRSPQRKHTSSGREKRLLRRRSSRLPLERTPAGQRMHDIQITLSTATSEITHSATSCVEETRSLHSWRVSAMDAYDGFDVFRSQEEVDDLASRLKTLLIGKGSDGEMVQDVHELVREAFVSHGRRVDTGVEDVP